MNRQQQTTSLCGRLKLTAFEQGVERDIVDSRADVASELEHLGDVQASFYTGYLDEHWSVSLAFPSPLTYHQRDAASRTDSAPAHHRTDYRHQAILLPVGTDAGHSRATGRGASDPRREDHRARQDKAVHHGPGTLSRL